MDEKSLEDMLFPVEPAQYGDRYPADFVALFDSFVESADRVSARRAQANSFFLTVNTLLVTAAGTVWELSDASTNWFIALGGILFSIVWWAMIDSFRTLNSAKYAVINEIETRLPIAAYRAEWALLKGRHKPLTTIEVAVPFAFMLLYAVALIFGVVQRLG